VESRDRIGLGGAGVAFLADASTPSVAPLSRVAGGPEAGSATKGGVVLSGGSGILRRARWPGLVLMLVSGVVAACLAVWVYRSVCEGGGRRYAMGGTTQVPAAARWARRVGSGRR